MLLIVLFSFLVITIIIVAIVVSKNNQTFSEFCSSSSDCPQGYECIENPELENKKQCFPSDKIFCAISPSTALMKCKLSDPNSCDACLNNPAFSCVEVTPDKPFSWTHNGQPVYIPPSAQGYGWCLPKVDNSSIKCNLFTSQPMLEQIGDKEFEWGCTCKYNVFGHDSTADSSCTHVLACGQDNDSGTLYTLTSPNEKDWISCKQDTDCSGISTLSGKPGMCRAPMTSPLPCGYANGSSGLEPKVDCSKDSSKCYCHVPWEGTLVDLVDPLSGQCVCNDDRDYQCITQASDSFAMNCVQGFCQPFSEAIGSGSCNKGSCFIPPGGNDCICCSCPEGYIRCPDDIPSNNIALINYCKNTGPTCIKDPCSTDEVPNGYWNLQEQQCVCPGDASAAKPDPDSAVGQYCANLCGKNSPCGSRGSCYVANVGGTKQALCCSCTGGFTNKGDPSCTCSELTGKQPIMGTCEADTDCASGHCCGVKCTWSPDHTERICTSGNCCGTDPINSQCGTDTCVPNSTGPVLCGGTSSCPQDSTCCQTSDGIWQCCPYPNGTCCDDGIHCCPSDHPVCNTKAGYCTKKDGSDPIKWSDSNPQ